MNHWRDRFPFVYVRRGEEHGALIRLTPEIAMQLDVYAQLSDPDRACAHAVAWGIAADSAILAGKASARLQGVAVRDSTGPVDLCLRFSNPRSSAYWPAGVHYRRAKLRDDQLLTLDGIRMTRKGRTAADITRWYGLLDGLIAIDSIRHQHPNVPYSELTDAVLGPGVYRGRTLVRQALELSRPGIESPLESWARYELIHSDLDIDVRTQVEISGPRVRFRVDLLIDDWLIVEVDGAAKYDGITYGRSVDEVIRNERAREKWLQNQGYVVIRVGYKDLQPGPTGESRLIQLVREALARAGQRAPRR